MRVALGARDHTGWAALVALGIDEGKVQVVERRRLQLIDPGLPREAYHAAQGLGMAAAKALIERVAESASASSAAELAAVLAELRAAGHEPVAFAVGSAMGAVPESLEKILRSHALLHAAEGELYREALAGAAEDAGLEVTRFRQRELHDVAAVAIGIPAERLRAVSADLGRAFGPPWTSNQKEAVIAAWLALAGRPID
jgi:hypothetical protein